MRACRSQVSGCAEAPWSVDGLTRRKKKKKRKRNLAQDPGALTRDVIPGYGNVDHSGHVHMCAQKARRESCAHTHHSRV